MNRRRSVYGLRLRAAPALVTPTQRDLGWAAGFYEGEGCVAHANGSTVIVVNQVEREPLDRLLSLFGGRIYAIPARKSSQSSWRWRACGARARGVMMTLLVLPSRKRQAQIAKVLATGEVKQQRRS